jgi:hypothetical protein
MSSRRWEWLGGGGRGCSLVGSQSCEDDVGQPAPEQAERCDAVLASGELLVQVCAARADAAGLVTAPARFR